MDLDPINWYQRPRSTLGEVRCANVDPSLPPPWKEVIDGATGRFYYWNTETNATQFEKPDYQVSFPSFYPFPYQEPVPTGNTSVPPASALFEPPHFSPPSFPTSHQTQPLALPVPVVHDLLNQIAAIQQTIAEFSNTREEALRQFQERRSQWPCRTTSAAATSSACSVHSIPQPYPTDDNQGIKIPVTHPYPNPQHQSSILPDPHPTNPIHLHSKLLFNSRSVMAAKARVYKKTRTPPLHSGVGCYVRPKLHRKRRIWVVQANPGVFFPEFDEALCHLYMGPTTLAHISPQTATNPSSSPIFNVPEQHEVYLSAAAAEEPSFTSPKCECDDADVPNNTTHFVAFAGATALDPELSSLNAAPTTLQVISLTNATSLEHINSCISTRQSPPLIGEVYSTSLRSVETPLFVIRAPLGCHSSSVVSVTGSLRFASLDSVVFVETNAHEKETYGLSVVHLDWRYDTAGKLLVVLRPTHPKGVEIQSRVVYPWDFGIHQMKAEEIHSPIPLIGAPDVEGKDEVLLGLSSGVNIACVASAFATVCAATFGMCPTMVQPITMKAAFGMVIRFYNWLFGACELFHDDDRQLEIHEDSAIVTQTHLSPSLWDEGHLSQNTTKEEIEGAYFDTNVQIWCFEPMSESHIYAGTAIPCHNIEFLLELPCGVQLLFDRVIKAPSPRDFKNDPLDLSHCYRNIIATATSQFPIVSGTPQIIIHELQGLPHTFELHLLSEINDFEVLGSDHYLELAFLSANCSPYLRARYQTLCRLWISIMGKDMAHDCWSGTLLSTCGILGSPHHIDFTSESLSAAMYGTRGRAILDVYCVKLLMQSHLERHSLVMLFIGATCWKPSSEECYHEKEPTEPPFCSTAAYPLCDECYRLVLNSNDKLSVSVPTVSSCLFHVLIFLMGSSFQPTTAAQSIPLQVAIVWNCLLIPSSRFIFIISGPTPSHLNHAALHSDLWSALRSKDIAPLQTHSTVITTIVLGVLSQYAEGYTIILFLLRNFSMAEIVAFLNGTSKLSCLRYFSNPLLSRDSVTHLHNYFQYLRLALECEFAMATYCPTFSSLFAALMRNLCPFSPMAAIQLLGTLLANILRDDAPYIIGILVLKSIIQLVSLKYKKQGLAITYGIAWNGSYCSYVRCSVCFNEFMPAWFIEFCLVVIHSWIPQLQFSLPSQSIEVLLLLLLPTFVHCQPMRKDLIMENGTIPASVAMIFDSTARQSTVDEYMVRVFARAVSTWGCSTDRNEITFMLLVPHVEHKADCLVISPLIYTPLFNMASLMPLVLPVSLVSVILGDYASRNTTGVLCFATTTPFFAELMIGVSTASVLCVDNATRHTLSINTEQTTQVLLFLASGTMYLMLHACVNVTTPTYKFPPPPMEEAMLGADVLIKASHERRMVDDGVSWADSLILEHLRPEDMPYLKGGGMLGLICYTYIWYWATLFIHLSGLLGLYKWVSGSGSVHLI